MTEEKKWIAPPPPGIPADTLPLHEGEPSEQTFPDPRRPFDNDRPLVTFEPQIRDWASKAKVADHADAILDFTRDAIAEYVRDCVRDREIAWPTQIRDFGVRVRKARKLLQLEKAEGTILRATAVSPFLYKDALNILAALDRELDAIARSKGPLVEGGWPAVNHARQFALAERFWATFLSKGWPTKTNPRALMHRIFKLVLEAAGEQRGTIKRLLESAKPNT